MSESAASDRILTVPSQPPASYQVFFLKIKVLCIDRGSATVLSTI
jgi:hypothetical protein